MTATLPAKTVLVVGLVAVMIAGTISYAFAQSNSSRTIEDLWSVVDALSGRVAALELALTSFNQPPQVNAGPDIAIMLSSAAPLKGTADDDGLLRPVTTMWSQSSGPGTAKFSNASAWNTTATFSSIGTYILDFEASDGLAMTPDQVTVNVVPDNTPPKVYVGSDQTKRGTVTTMTQGVIKTMSCQYSLVAAVKDDGLPNPTLQVSWKNAGSAVHGNTIGRPDITVRFQNPHSTATSITIENGGYGHPVSFSVFPEMTVYDGFHTVSDTFEFRCNAP